MRGHKWATEEERVAAVRTAQRRYVERHPERRSATIKAAWERLRADPVRYQRFLRQGRESYARNPLAGYLYALNWRGENRERTRANRREASARRRERVGPARREVNEYAIVLRSDPCSYCGGPGGIIDHIAPLAEEGEHEVGNLTGACRRCNARKRTIPLLAFLLRARAATAA